MHTRYTKEARDECEWGSENGREDEENAATEENVFPPRRLSHRLAACTPHRTGRLFLFFALLRLLGWEPCAHDDDGEAQTHIHDEKALPKITLQSKSTGTS